MVTRKTPLNKGRKTAGGYESTNPLYLVFGYKYNEYRYQQLKYMNKNGEITKYKCLEWFRMQQERRVGYFVSFYGLCVFFIQ